MSADPDHSPVRPTGRPAVVLLSGGLDSTTCLAIARAEGFAPVALSFRYGQRHTVELDCARRVAEAAGVEHLVADIDLRRLRRLGPHRRTSRCPSTTTWPSSPTRPTAARSRSPTCRPATRSSCRFALAVAEVRGAADIFIGVNAVDYSGYPDCRPEFVAAFEAMANLATRAGVEGRPPHHPHAADRPHQGRHHPAGPRASASTTASPSTCYDPGTDGGACGRCDACLLRRQGLRRRRPARPDPLHREPDGGARDRVDLPGEGGVPHPPGRGRPRRAARRVLPLHRLQPLDRARGAPGRRGVPVLRHRLRRAPTAPAAARSAAPTRWPPHVRSFWPGDDRPAGFVVCTGGEPTAPARRRRWSTPCTPAASRSPSRPTAPGRCRPASTGCASAPRPAPSSCSTGPTS